MRMLKLGSLNFYNSYIDGLVQERSISIAKAVEIWQSCTKPSLLCPANMHMVIWSHQCQKHKGQILQRVVFGHN